MAHHDPEPRPAPWRPARRSAGPLAFAHQRGRARRGRHPRRLQRERATSATNSPASTASYVYDTATGVPWRASTGSRARPSSTPASCWPSATAGSTCSTPSCGAPTALPHRRVGPGRCLQRLARRSLHRLRERQPHRRLRPRHRPVWAATDLSRAQRRRRPCSRPTGGGSACCAKASWPSRYAHVIPFDPGLTWAMDDTHRAAEPDRRASTPARTASAGHADQPMRTTSRTQELQRRLQADRRIDELVGGQLLGRQVGGARSRCRRRSSGRCPPAPGPCRSCRRLVGTVRDEAEILAIAEVA